MIKVDQYGYIRTAYRVYGKTIREISRETGHSRNTVRKALRKEHWGYSGREKQPYPVLGPYINIIDRWLMGDKESPKKQRHTAKRIYNRLCHEHGYEGSERTVRRYVHDAKRRLGLSFGDVYIPLDPDLGSEAEVDWGNCVAILGGKRVKLKMFVMRSKGSGKSFVQCFPCERQQAFFEGHKLAFQFYGGVFRILIYDNLGSAVEKVFRGKGRKLRDNFVKFQVYYNFEPRFCNPDQGHEKGGVEGLVGYARRNFMVPIPEAESLEQLNAYLWEQCAAHGNHRIAGREKTINELHEVEKQHILALPDYPFTNVEIHKGKVGKYGTVIVDKNHYSVPLRYAGLRVKAVCYIDRVDLFHGGKKISSHERVYGNNKWQLDPFHYLDLILIRPQAFDSARPIKRWRKEWPECLEKLLEHFRARQGQSKGTKEFIKVLMLFNEHDDSEVLAAVEEAVSANVSSSDAVEQLLVFKTSSDETDFVPAPNWDVFPPPDVRIYDRLGGGR